MKKDQFIEAISLYKPFELKVDKEKDVIKDYQLEKYFLLDKDQWSAFALDFVLWHVRKPHPN